MIQKHKLLIDLDGILFRCLFATQETQGYYGQLRACNTTVERIIERWEPEEFRIFLTGAGNFRKKIYPQYKANRDPNHRPKYLHDTREWFVKYWGAEICHGMEADDALAMNADKWTIMVGNDKDYLTVPNTWLWNPFKEELVWTGEEEADRCFFAQCLTGDSSDNIPGLHRVGPKTAEKILVGKNKSEMLQAVLDEYKKHYPEDWWNEFDRNASLLFLRRAPDATYDQYYL
jgi:5'-3' exonuclease